MNYINKVDYSHYKLGNLHSDYLCNRGIYPCIKNIDNQMHWMCSFCEDCFNIQFRLLVHWFVSASRVLFLNFTQKCQLYNDNSQTYAQIETLYTYKNFG